MTEVIRCTKCILPATQEGIDFDSFGVCNFCREFVPVKPLGEKALLKKLKKVKGEKYDCVVPVSGGRDSTYVLYILKRKYGRNPLAVNFHNGFAHPLAIENLERACKILGVELRIESAPFNLTWRVARSLIRSAIPYGPKDMLNNICTHCSHGAHGAVQRVMLQEGLEYIISGTSHPEDTVVDWGMFPKISKKKKLLSPNVLRMLSAIGYYFTHRASLKVPGDKVIDFNRPSILHEMDGKYFSLFDYLEWDRVKIKETITNELGWRKPEGRATSWRYDCKLVPLVNYLTKHGTGVEKLVDGFSTMIRYGKLTREEALQQIGEWDGGVFSKDVEEVLKDGLKLSGREIERIKNI